MSLGEIGIIEVLLLCLVGFASGARRFLTLLSSPALPLGSEGSLPCAADFCVDNIGSKDRFFSLVWFHRLSGRGFFG